MWSECDGVARSRGFLMDKEQSRTTGRGRRHIGRAGILPTVGPNDAGIIYLGFGIPAPVTGTYAPSRSYQPVVTAATRKESLRRERPPEYSASGRERQATIASAAVRRPMWWGRG